MMEILVMETKSCPQGAHSPEGTYSHCCERHLSVVSKLQEKNFIHFYFAKIKLLVTLYLNDSCYLIDLGNLPDEVSISWRGEGRGGSPHMFHSSSSSDIYSNVMFSKKLLSTPKNHNPITITSHPTFLLYFSI